MRMKIKWRCEKVGRRDVFDNPPKTFSPNKQDQTTAKETAVIAVIASDGEGCDEIITRT